MGASTARSLTLLGLPLLACAPQADVTYAGEPKLTLSGVVVNTEGAPAPGVRPTVFWTQPDPDFDANEASGVVVRLATFDGAFELSVMAAPPASIRYVFGKTTSQAVDGRPTTALNIGFIGARDGSRLAAVAPHHMIAFLEDDAPAGSCAAAYLGAPLRAGFHLLRGENRTYEQAIAERKACLAEIDSDAPADVTRERSLWCDCATRASARLWPVESNEPVAIGFGAKPLGVFELAPLELSELELP